MKNNFFHHLGSNNDKNHGTCAVYHDDGACGMNVISNIFYKTGTRASLVGGGFDNEYRNNLFIQTPLAISVDMRFRGWAKNNTEILKERTKMVNNTKPPYSISYPSYVNYLETDITLPKGNIIDNNIFVNCHKLIRVNDEANEMTENNYNLKDEKLLTKNFIFDDYLKITKDFKQFSVIDFDRIGYKSK